MATIAEEGCRRPTLKLDTEFECRLHRVFPLRSRTGVLLRGPVMGRADSWGAIVQRAWRERAWLANNS